jgi:hypothetical protein
MSKRVYALLREKNKIEKKRNKNQKQLQKMWSMLHISTEYPLLN